MRVTETDLSVLRPAPDRPIPLPSSQRLRFSNTWTVYEETWRRSSSEVLAFFVYRSIVPPLLSHVKWVALQHQSGGLQCSHPHFIGFELSLTEKARDQFRKIAAHFYNHHTGYFGPTSATAEDLDAYRAMLAPLGLTCDVVHSDLHESFYPVDATPRNYEALTGAPPRDGLISQAETAASIIVLCENSD